MKISTQTVFSYENTRSSYEKNQADMKKFMIQTLPRSCLTKRPIFEKANAKDLSFPK